MLKTSLVEAKCGRPLLNLLRSGSVEGEREEAELQGAACAVVANLILPFSPMREVSSSLVSCFRKILLLSSDAVVGTDATRGWLLDKIMSFGATGGFHAVRQIKRFVRDQK